MKAQSSVAFYVRVEGSVDFEMGNYALPIESTEEGQLIIKIAGVGEYEVPHEVLQELENQPGSAHLSNNERANIIIGKMIGIGQRLLRERE